MSTASRADQSRTARRRRPTGAPCRRRTGAARPDRSCRATAAGRCRSPRSPARPAPARPRPRSPPAAPRSVPAPDRAGPGSAGCARPRRRTRAGRTRVRAARPTRPAAPLRRRRQVRARRLRRRSPAAVGAVIAPGAIERDPRAASASIRRRQSSSLGLRGCARTMTTDPPPAEIGAELLASGDEILAIANPPLEDGALKRDRRLLGGALGRSHALHLGGDQCRHETQERTVDRTVGGPHPQPAHGRLGDLQLDRRHVLGIAHERPLVRRGARRHRQHGRRPVDQDQARVERPCGGAEDRRQPGAAFDRIGDRRERSKVGRGARRTAHARGQPIGAIPARVRASENPRPLDHDQRAEQHADPHKARPGRIPTAPRPPSARALAGRP